MDEMQNQIKELQRAQQKHVVSNTVGLSVRTLVSKLPQEEQENVRKMVNFQKVPPVEIVKNEGEREIQ